MSARRFGTLRDQCQRFVGFLASHEPLKNPIGSNIHVKTAFLVNCLAMARVRFLYVPK